MKLSEAIRLNGMMKRQGRGRASLLSLDAPCALGGALQSIGRQPKTEGEAFAAFIENWSFLTVKRAKCPCGRRHVPWFKYLGNTRKSMAATIIYLNDHHGWTRNQIADWVATVEPAEEVKREFSTCRRPISNPGSDRADGRTVVKLPQEALAL